MSHSIHSSPNLQNPNQMPFAGGKPDRGQSRVTAIELAFFRRLLRTIGSPKLAIRFWDGQQLGAADPVACIVIGDRATLWKLVWDPLFQFGDAYANGRLQVEGDLIALLAEMFGLMNRLKRTPSWMERFARWMKPRRKTDLHSSKSNIHNHYDIGNDFYQLWLDEQMVYTCAYYEHPDFTLEQAQRAKMDHVCRKVWLRPGEKVVEAGCGWGAMAIHMARNYGVSVRACNISHEQIDYARSWAKREGLADRVEFIEDDWRNIDGQYDVFMAVGMLEHVGVAHYQQLGQVASSCIGSTGRGLIHTIGQNYPEPMNPWIERRIFPGAQTPSLREIMGVFEPNNLSVLDVENLRLHYEATLREWLRRFETVVDVVQEKFDEKFVRTWRLYLAGSAAAFHSGCMQLFQVVFADAEANHVPWTRTHQYSSAAPPSQRSASP